MVYKKTRLLCYKKNFVEYQRLSGLGFAKFIRECSRRVGEINKYNGQLEGGLLAYFQLNASNLCNDHERLVRALVSLNFDDIKDKLQEVFGILGAMLKHCL